MRFTFQGRNFKLGFERHYRQVHVMRQGKHQTVRSKYPYTTVTLYELKDNGNAAVILSHATVGCLHTDPYSNANGRLFALRALTGILKRSPELTREFRAALWRSYLTRDKQQPVIETTATRVPEPVHTAGTQLALRPTTEGELLDQRIIH